MQPDRSRPDVPQARTTAIALCLATAALLRICTHDDRAPYWFLLVRLVLDAGVILLFVQLGRNLKGATAEQKKQTGTAIAIVACADLLLSVVLRNWELGISWEMALLSAHCVAMLGLIGAHARFEFERLAVTLSLLLILFTATQVSVATAIWALFVYAVPASMWLLLSHWQQLRPRLLQASNAPVRRRWVIWTLPLAAVMLLGLSFSGERPLNRIAGWFPSSGGNGEEDLNARDGIGDGAAVVPGEENVTSFAPLEDAPFLEDDQRSSLYDAYDESYNQPSPKKKRVADKAVAVDRQDVRRASQEIASADGRSREFSTIRRDEKPQSREVGDRTSDALLFVAGRVPLHLRAQVFHHFDGQTWKANLLRRPPARRRIETHAGRPWLMFDQSTYPALTVAEHHVLKFVRYKEPIIPSPPHTVGISISQVNTPRMYRWEQVGVLALDRDTMPSFLAIRTSSQRFDHRKRFSSVPRSDRQINGVLRLPGGAAIKRLAEQWTADVDTEWGTIERIIERLREDYVHDREQVVSDHEELAVNRFLTETKAGPDYLFASAAALLLRAKGFDCRVVSGFYAPSEKYDHKTKLTRVDKEDVHFWVELHVGLGVWVPLEPTPGYEILGPKRGFVEASWLVIADCISWMRRNPLAVISLLGSLTLLWVYRVTLKDVAHRIWRFRPGQTPASHVAGAFSLIERRLAWAGLVRPAHVSPRSWWARLDAGISPEGDRLLRCMEQMAFRPGIGLAIPKAEARALSRAVLSNWKLSRLKAVAREREPSRRNQKLIPEPV